MAKAKKVIQVAGDMVVDIFRYPRPAEAGENLPAWKRLPGVSEIEQRGGALLLADLIRTALPQCTVLSENIDSATTVSRQTLAGYAGVWRASSLDGFDVKINEDSPSANITLKNVNPDTMVLFDSDNGFNSSPDLWPVTLKDASFTGSIFIRLSNPLAETKLVQQIQKIRKKSKKPVVAVVSADDLRATGACISRGLSWERTMIDFCTEMLKGPKPYPLLERFDLLVVRFGYEGAIAVDCTRTLQSINDQLCLIGSLLFDNNFGEGDLDRSFSGKMVGVTSVFMAGLIRGGTGPSLTLKTIQKGIRSGLAATYTYLTDVGLGQASRPPAYPLTAVGETLRKAAAGNHYSEAELIELADTDPRTPEVGFSIVDKLVPDTLTSLANLIVIKGDVSFRNVPKGNFGKLLTVERTEIENYRKIQNLMLEYLAVPSSERPLCFAVFGPPGSGKSFGVKQLAKKISKSGNARIEKLTFNLSEFRSPDELVRAFHLVRDSTLSGAIPLVFFDEFDSTKDGQKLFWLKYFLAPMQDGEFRDGEAIHPIGKALFVFAGGTCASYEEFSNRTGDEFKDVKGPDFVSRLRGHLSVMGPNPASSTDFGYIVRRALLLRCFLEQRAKKLGSRQFELMDPDHQLEIDKGLLSAFLQVPKYRHGVRSMQSVIDMSAIDQGSGYRKSEIPAFDQLDMHVDAEVFLYLLHRDEQFEPYVDQIAQLIHKGYLIDRKTDNTRNLKKATHLPWAKLPEETRESNRQQARDIPEKLSLYNIRIEKDVGQESAALSDEEVSYLSQVEHRRWMRQEKETPTAPVHPCMIRWGKLSKHEQRKDIVTISRIPEYLKACGLVMVR